MTTLRSLLGAEGVVTGSPAEPAAIAKVASLFRAGLPEDLLDVWGVSNGMALEPIDAELLSCEQVLEFSREGPGGILPLFHDRQSNYLALAMDEPLAFRLLHVPHDDGPRLLFTGIESCVNAILAGLGLGSGESLDIFLSETDGDYAPEARRSERDQRAGRALLLTDGKNHEWNFATTLLDETNLPEFARLLETDHFVRRDVRDRMDAMKSPDIRKLLGQDRKAFDAFRTAVSVAATSAGMKVEKGSGDTVLRIAGKYIELETFFHRRHEPDAMSQVIARVKELTR